MEIEIYIYSLNFRKDICEKFVATTLKFVYMYKVAVSITYLLLVQMQQAINK